MEAESEASASVGGEGTMEEGSEPEGTATILQKKAVKMTMRSSLRGQGRAIAEKPSQQPCSTSMSATTSTRPRNDLVNVHQHFEEGLYVLDPDSD